MRRAELALKPVRQIQKLLSLGQLEVSLYLQQRGLFAALEYISVFFNRPLELKIKHPRVDDDSNETTFWVCLYYRCWPLSRLLG